MPPSETISATAATPVRAADALRVASSTRFSWRRLAAFVGPGYLVAVGYMDPGNWATDLAGGSQFGYALLPVIALSSLVAMFLQWLALRLGIASGLDLAQHCRKRFSPRVTFFLWATCEIAIIACDLAEVIGTAIALNLLFHMPLPAGVLITALDTFIIMALERRGFRYIEALVITLTGVIGVCFAFELLCCAPDLHKIVSSFASPTAVLGNSAALYVALGIFGATVMPHNLYLHSSIAQSRRDDHSPECKRRTIAFSTVDCFSALVIALLINAAILILAAAAFHFSGHTGVAGISDAYKLLTPMFGPAAAMVFGIALLGAGQNSTVTGTMAGQITMEGFLGLKMKPVPRRLLTRGLALIPALAVAIMAGEKGTDRLLIASQVILSLQLGFAVIPLVMFTADKSIMGEFRTGRMVRSIAWIIAAGIVCANLWLAWQVLG
jgi:manganese transport protein